MYARVATFENDPARIDASAERIRAAIDSDDLPEGMRGLRFLLLANRDTGRTLGVALFDTEQEMMAADEAMNAGPGEAGARSSVEFYEVPVHTLG